MLPKKYRITKKKEFDQIFKQGKSAYDDILGMKVIKNELDCTRFGIVVSTKVSKKAVERNKIKRRIRSFLNKNINNLKPGFDVVVLTLPKIKEANISTINEKLYKNLLKIRLYNNGN